MARRKRRRGSRVTVLVDDHDSSLPSPDEGATDDSAGERPPAPPDPVEDSPIGRLRAWIASCGLTESGEVDVWIYRYVGMTKQKELVTRTSLLMDEDAIGREYGSGRYLVLIQLPKDSKGKRRVNSATITLAADYDRERGRSAGPAEATTAEVGLRMVESVVRILAPLLQQRQAMPDYGPILVRNYEEMNKVMTRSLLQNQRLLADSMGEDGGGVEVSAEDAGAAAGSADLSKIVQLACTWLPKILGGGPQGEAIAGMVKDSTELATIQRNPRDYARLLGAMDKRLGREKVDRLLSRLKLRRPVG